MQFVLSGLSDGHGIGDANADATDAGDDDGERFLTLCHGLALIRLYDQRLHKSAWTLTTQL